MLKIQCHANKEAPYVCCSHSSFLNNARSLYYGRLEPSDPNHSRGRPLKTAVNKESNIFLLFATIRDKKFIITQRGEKDKILKLFLL